MNAPPTPQPLPPLLEHALAHLNAGLAIVPIRPDGQKRPSIPWKTYQDTLPSVEEVTHWFTTHDTDGLGAITGAGSGNLEMLEVEGRAVHLTTELSELMADNGLGEVWARINAGWVEVSPSGGIHWHYRISDGPARGNTKLARRPATAAELDVNPGEKIKVLVETRGQGGFTVLAPSAGRTHATGKPWTLIAGSPTTCPTITSAERDQLYAIAAILDEMPVEDVLPPTTTFGTDTERGTRPGDDYNKRATWDQILTPRGWSKARKIGDGYGWTRPGKSISEGISATTGTSADGADRLYVFSSSTEFDPEKPYSKFAAYVHLEHGGDYSAAAKALRSDGYGTEPHMDVATGAPFGTVDGNLATVTALPPPGERPLKAVTERTLAHSDDANALALINAHGDVLRHCSDRGRWYAWNGATWAQCPRHDGPAREYAKRIARALPEDDPKAVTHKKRSLSAVGISAMLTQAATDDRVSVGFDELDAHPWELNTPGGIIDMRTGTLGPSDPSRLHTRTTSCTPDPDADRSVWLQFLTDTFGQDQALIDYLQRLIGYSAIGFIGPHVLPFAFGSGGNGKGVFLEASMKVLGDYATTAPAGFLMARQHASHETEIARLSGARMVLCSEVNEGDKFDEAKVKLLTGGDSITARFMHQDHFTFTPTHQLWLMGNHQPTVQSGGRSFWRRLRLIPFLYEVPPEKVVDDLQGMLASEHGPAILSWIIDGAAQYHQRGLDDPPAVLTATAEYAHDQDSVARFVEEQCFRTTTTVVTKVAEVRAAYEKWCYENGDDPVSAKSLTTSLAKMGVDSKRTKHARMYAGLTLLSADDPSPDLSPERGSAAADQGWR